MASITVQVTRRERVVQDPDGHEVAVPDGWELLPPGDPMLTRRVKAGPHWVMVEKRGPKVFTRGVWAPGEAIARAEVDVAAERANPSYAKKLAQGRDRRAKEQAEYVEDFAAEVRAFLAFHERHAAIADEMARRISEHATPVGSGTVARTERIPIAERAEAATIAWMRHQTTAYDSMSIARVAGARHEVRRMLAERSRALLARYRRGDEPAADCPLRRALQPHEPKPTAPMSTHLLKESAAPQAPMAPPAPTVPPTAPTSADDERLHAERMARMKAVRARRR